MSQPAFHRFPGAPPLIIAHRGLSSRAPENTLAAFRRAIDTRADLVELDVHLSADEEVVVIHDRTLQRTTTGNGPVRSYRLSELKTFDAGSWFHPDFSAERIPTLDEVLSLCGSRCRVNIELKSHPFHREPTGLLEQRVLDVVKQNRMIDRVLISSFDHRLLKSIQHLHPGVQTGALFSWHHRFQNRARDLVGKGEVHIAICSYREANAFLKRKALQPGIALFVYVVNNAEDAARFADLPVDGLITDSPDLLRDRLGITH